MDMKNIRNMNNFMQKNVLVCDGGGNAIWGEEKRETQFAGRRWAAAAVIQMKRGGVKVKRKRERASRVCLFLFIFF
jgi:hypothetical protein